LGSFHAFKNYFGVWIKAEDVKQEWGYDPGYDQLVDYKNVDKLEVMLKKISSRITKEDAGLNLPPKLYTKRYFELTTAQRKAYDELVDEFFTELDDGTFVEASLAIVRLLRLQQITCGYISSEAEEPVKMIGEKNPRMELLKEVVEEIPHKAIIWARFTKDIDQIMEHLGDKAVRYDGQVSGDDRAAAKERFQNGDAKFFVGNPAAGATGLTLHAAKSVI
jgi:SNF2 family DNA or RNA helicase